MNAPFKTDALPEWRLDDLYAGREDPRIEADLAAAKRLNDELAKLEGRFIASPRRGRPSWAACIDRGIELYEQATNGLWGVGAYAASLAASTARDDPAWAKFEADLRARSSQIAAREPVLHAGAEPAGGRRAGGGAEGPPGGRPLAALAAPRARCRARTSCRRTWSGCCVDRGAGRGQLGAGCPTRPWPS